uniref:5-dehydro-2-deoxygluconokinase n=3 Tax=Enterocloster clostridioformis TaxID=1531 RepID=UPI00080C889F|nr:5-dehydro-2-deoxygluconokinase [Enterocloster clostridioformis]
MSDGDDIMQLDRFRKIDVIAMGRATVDLYANETGPMEDAKTFSKYVGGSPANTAVAMANLGLKVGYIGKVSDDAFGRFLCSYLNGKGVDVSHIRTDDTGRRSGLTMGEIREDGKCSYFMYRQDCADLNIQCTEIDEKYIADAKMLLISGTSLTHSPARESVFLAMSYARKNNTRIILDLDYRTDTWDTEEEASVYYHMAALQSDMVIGTREEFDVMERMFLPGNRDDKKSAEYFLERGAEYVSIKRGKEGSCIYTKEDIYHGGVYPVKAVKTFGAGDAYSGAFNYGIISGFTMEKCLMYAAAAASITISGHSCSDSTPTLEQIDRFITENDYICG